MEMVETREKSIMEKLRERFGYTNPMQAPRLTKIVVSSGTGKIADKNKIEVIKEGLARITGQKPSPRQAKQSIASFKLREGDIIGYQVTLHGPRMYGFLNKLIHIALPRTKDFRGLSRESVDEMGNLTIGIREHVIFPETSDEELQNIFGLSVTLVTTATNREEATAYFEEIGVPFKKEE
jgi:large subunit ribosomal protein L5